MTLNDLAQGESAIVVKVRGRGAFHKRITEMGFIRGKKVEVIRSAPFRDPVEYRIMGYEISLRRAEAQLIEVIPLDMHMPEKLSEYNGVIDEETLKTSAQEKGKIIDVVFVGNPNSGKTSLFNNASGSKERVGNYSGVTIDAKKAVFRLNGYTFNIIDLPGTYSLSAYSHEELYVREYILNYNPDIVINVVDASNLERNLYLTTQLIDMDMKVVIALNMYDELKSKGDEFDYHLFAGLIGIPIIPTIANKGVGIKNLFNKIIDVYEEKDPIVRHVHVNYGEHIEPSISILQKCIRESKSFIDKVAARYYAIKLLEKDSEISNEIETWEDHKNLHEIAEKEVSHLERIYNAPSETIIADSRYGFISGALKETYKPAETKDFSKTPTQKIDAVLTSRYWGFPLFLLFIFLMFFSTFTLGQYPMSWMESGIAFLGDILSQNISSPFWKDLVINGIIGGVGGVIVFLPNILILFFFISVMEDTGYMARVAFLMDKLMHRIGLHGKSFIPMIMGFGCNVPAIMATRTLENRNDRILTMLTIPFMSCSARLPVYILFAGTFFPRYAPLILFCLYLLGILLAILFALGFKRILFKSKEMPFVMELPPYRIPTFFAIMQNIWMKARHYLKKMGGVILFASLIIWFLGYFPRNENIEKEYDTKIDLLKKNFATQISIAETPVVQEELSVQKDEKIAELEQEKNSLKIENSYIGQIGKFIEPVIRPLGFEWKIGISLLSGIAAKEVIISTMGVIYQTGEEDEPKLLSNKIKNETYTSGPKVGEKVFTPLTVASLLVFVLLYFPCIAVFAAVGKESGRWRWAIFLVVYTTTLAWALSFTVYQVGNFIGFV